MESKGKFPGSNIGKLSSLVFFKILHTASKLKAELDEAKLKLGSEVKELQENAKSWITKQKEAADTNNDGKIDKEEFYAYVFRRLQSRNRTPRK